MRGREERRKKKKLRGRKEKIVEDVTWGEKKMKWRLEKIGREEKRGNRVWREYGKLNINRQWWKWK